MPGIQAVQACQESRLPELSKDAVASEDSSRHSPPDELESGLCMGTVEPVRLGGGSGRLLPRHALPSPCLFVSWSPGVLNCLCAGLPAYQQPGCHATESAAQLEWVWEQLLAGPEPDGVWEPDVLDLLPSSSNCASGLSSATPLHPVAPAAEVSWLAVSRALRLMARVASSAASTSLFMKRNRGSRRRRQLCSRCMRSPAAATA